MMKKTMRCSWISLCDIMNHSIVVMMPPGCSSIVSFILSLGDARPRTLSLPLPPPPPPSPSLPVSIVSPYLYAAPPPPSPPLLPISLSPSACCYDAEGLSWPPSSTHTPPKNSLHHYHHIVVIICHLLLCYYCLCTTAAVV